MALAKCPFCDGEVSTYAESCPHCGKLVKRPLTACPECGGAIPSRAATCGHCGYPVEANRLKLDKEIAGEVEVLVRMAAGKVERLEKQQALWEQDAKAVKGDGLGEGAAASIADIYSDQLESLSFELAEARRNLELVRALNGVE